MKRIILTIFLLVLMSFIHGCSFFGTLTGQTRTRLGCYATSTPGTRFIGFNSLGNHSFSGFGLGEGNGIVYTCRGGHIDITHLRLGADYTRNIAEKTYDCMIRGKKNFTFKLPVEPTVHHVELAYPENWKSLSKEQRQKIARQASFAIAPYFAFSATTWHEMLTWYGYKCMFLIPEDASGFSWEDGYSNLIGCLLSVEAMQDKEHSYDQAMTILIKKEMQKLGIQSSRDARNAAQKMRGKWFTGNLWVIMKKRNFDIGLDDGYVSPSIVPGFSKCPDAEPVLYPAPKPEVLSDYGFSMKYEIKPNEFEKDKLLKIIGGKRRVEPIKDFPKLIAHLEKEALEKGYEIR